MQLVGRQEGHLACNPVSDLSDWMLAWLGANLHMAQLIPLPLALSCSSKSRLVLPFWCQFTQVVLDKIQEGCKSVVCVVCVWLVLINVFLVTNHVTCSLLVFQHVFAVDAE